MIRLFMLALLGLAVLPWTVTAAAQPEVTVTLEAAPTEVKVGEMIRLEVRARVRGGRIQGLDLADLKKYPELEIVSHQTVRPMQFSFGFGSGMQVESSLANVFVLRTTAPGTFEFSPAVARVDGKTYRSQALELRVHPSTGSAGDGADEANQADAATPAELSGARFDERAFLRTVVEPEQAYVGQEVRVTVYLYTRLRLSPQSVIPSKPSMDGFWVYDDPITSLESQTVSVMGTHYRAYVLQRAVAFPQRSGELSIGAPEVAFDVGGMSLFDRPERVERQGVPVSVEVLPLPAPGPANAVVGQYELRAWLDRDTVDTGDAVTLRIDATGTGNVQDLRLALPPIVGVRALQPAIRDQKQFRNGKLGGTRSWEWILIAETPGEHAIPALELNYFDPETKEYGATSTGVLPFTASGAAKPSPAAIEPVEPRRAERAASFGPVRVYSALSREATPVRDRAWFGLLLAVPPLLFALVVLGVTVRRRREERSTTAGAVQRKLLRSAQSALEASDPREFYDRIVASIVHALDVRLGEPVGGMPHAALRNRLRQEGFDDDLIERLVNELEGADFARFAASGVDRDEMDRCLQRTTALVERVRRSQGAA